MPNDAFFNKLFEILASINYNSQRIEPLENVLRLFLAKQNTSLDIKSEARAFAEAYLSSKDLQGSEKVDALKSRWFKQESMLLTNTRSEFIPEYIISKFSPFEKDFEEKYGFDGDAIWKFCFKLSEYIHFKKYMNQFSDEVYAFNSKEEEYGDIGFVAIPSDSYIETWKNIVTIDISELKRVMHQFLSNTETEKIIQLLSITLDSCGLDKVKFSSKPLLRVDNKLIVLTPHYLTTALPLNYERYFNVIKAYRESKGKSFERLAQNTLKALPFESLSFNVRYGNQYEVDAVLEFKKSVWFVEMTSHMMSDSSLDGNLRSIEKDLKKTVDKCVKQGKRCFEYKDSLPLKYFFKEEKINGIFIVVDGVYPQLNINKVLNFFEQDVPIYIINWFDYRLLLEQEELSQFEDFILWRTQKIMPIVCVDEKDYWAYYFDHHLKDWGPKVFKHFQDNNITFVYISHRFNQKDHLKILQRKQRKQ